MATLAAPYFTAKQYLDYDRSSDVKNEYLFGEILPVYGATPWHGLLSANVIFALKSRLAGGPCRVFDASLRASLDPKSGYVYPDATVVCGPLAYVDGKKDTVSNPKIVVEVLSPSTAEKDLGLKARLYWDVPSLSVLIFVEQSRVWIESWSRLPDGKWDRTLLRSPDDVLKIDSAKIEIPVREIYEGVEFPPEPAPAE